MKVKVNGRDLPICIEVNCEHCKSVLTIDKPEDIRFYGGSDYPIIRSESYWVRCPVCNAQPDISMAELKKLPPVVLSEARDKWYNR